MSLFSKSMAVTDVWEESSAGGVWLVYGERSVSHGSGRESFAIWTAVFMLCLLLALNFLEQEKQF